MLNFFKFFQILNLLALLSLSPLGVFAKPYYRPPYHGDVGLNVHWSLSGFNRDALYRQRLFESKTKWVREHFYTEVFNVEKPEAWFVRYDQIMSEYRAQNIKVVGMLAYGFNHNERTLPEINRWLVYVEMIVTRYQNDVEIWEVWNEPDSPDYLQPNSPENYAPFLAATAAKIKSINPQAKVMNGGLASPNLAFAAKILELAPNALDAFAVHYYYADEYLTDGNLNRLENGAKNLRRLIDQKKPGLPIWVTEMGASTGTPGLSEKKQTDYLKAATELLIRKGYVGRILLYTFRNFDYNTSYENNFGLLKLNLETRSSWEWYAGLLRGPYNKFRLKPSAEKAGAEKLKTELEKYFGAGQIPGRGESWDTLTQAYLYGGYSVQSIVQAIRYGGKTVHPMFSFNLWQTSADYQNYINKDWTGGMIPYAYGKPRVKISLEKEKALELRNLLGKNYSGADLKITAPVWNDLVRAYVYGHYPLEALAKAVRSNWLTVSKNQPFEVWKNTSEYQSGIKINLKP